MDISRKKIWKWINNGLLVAVALVLIVPSWRVSFQGWFAHWFLSDAHFAESNEIVQIDPEVKNWPLFNMDSQLTVFEEFEGKPVLLSFWATWCGPCRAELRELEQLKESMGSEIYVAAVSTETIEVIQDSGLDNDYDFLYFADGVPSQFDVQAYPTLFLLDSELNIVHKSTGAANLNTEENINFLRNI
ncbi:MAG: TlpA family protein disulfide reductase [Flavobacteriales bacterium]|nr:TlpA family protein disulfide reductase [Flavobacteriales bacterium]